MSQSSVTLRWVPMDGHSLLYHAVDEKGVLQGLTSVGIVGGLLDDETGHFHYYQTARGRTPALCPVMGPDGEVTMDGRVWPSADAYGEWARENMN